MQCGRRVIFDVFIRGDQIVAECGGLQDYVTIYVPAYQAAYLTQNLYDPETYEQDNLEWDSIIYAKPSAKPG